MSRTVWRQFGLATLLVVAYVLLSNYHSFVAHPQFAERAGGLVPAILLQLPRAIFFALPLAVGVSLSLLPSAPGAFRTAIWVAGFVTAVPIVNDLVARDLWRAVENRSMGEVADDRPPRFDDTTGTLGGTLAHLLGRVRPEDIQPWPPKESTFDGLATIRDPRVIIRLSAVRKYSGALDMLLPGIIAGFVLGLSGWLGRIATFRSPRDERVLRLGLGWGMSICAFFGLTALSAGSYYTLSSPRASLWWMVAPYLIAMVPAFLGWRAVWRLDRLGAE